MWRANINIDKFHAKALDYIFKRLNENGKLIYASSETKTRCILEIAYEGEDILEIKSEVLGIVFDTVSIFYKTEFIVRVMQKPFSSFAEVAYLGAMLRFEKENEKKEFYSAVNDMYEYSIDAIFEFRIEKLREDWASLALLSSRLLSMCEKDTEIYEATMLLTTYEKDYATIPHTNLSVTVSKDDDGYFLKVQNKSRSIPELFPDPEKNLLCEILRLSASSVIIEKADNFSNEFVKAVEMLGA